MLHLILIASDAVAGLS